MVGAPQGPLYSKRSEPLSFLGKAHLAAARWQPFLYVFLSEPQTGLSFDGQFLGHGLEDGRLLHAPERSKMNFKTFSVHNF